MLSFRSRWSALVLSLLLVASSYSSSLKMEFFSREDYPFSCLDSLSSADSAQIGEDGEVCVDLSTKPADRTLYEGLPEVLASACITMNEERDGLNVQFTILDGLGNDYVFKRTQGGAYAWKGQIPRRAYLAHRTSNSHTGNVKETTMSLDLTVVHRECCAKGILVTLRAIVYPTSYPGSRIVLYPAEDDSRMCTRIDQSRVTTCKIPVSCEEESCPVRDTAATTCVRTNCPDTTTSVGPVDCEIIDEAVGAECSLYGDPGSWQVGTYGNNCACELNATPEPCIIDGEDAGFFPGDACSSESSENAIAIRASEDGECVCSPQVGSVLCDDSMVSGTQCVARFSGAAGVVVHLGTDFFDNIQCECAVPCEYATNPVSNPSALAVGHVGQGCTVELAGSDVTPPGVLVRLDLGTCFCKPLEQVLGPLCVTPDARDSFGEQELSLDVPYLGCRLISGDRGVSIPTDADPTVCDCVPKELCQCPPGEVCEYTGMIPGDSCETEFGTGFLAQRNDSLGCNCRINCTLSPCDDEVEDCDNWTFGTCDLDGVEGFVVPTSDAGMCTCVRCDAGECAHPDAGCIVEGASCTNLAGRMDVFFSDEGTKCNCGCELSIPFKSTRSSSLGNDCGQGLATGVIVDGFVEGKCSCQVQNCTSSNCEGPDCPTFDGVIGQTCESETGIIMIAQDGSCKCQRICETINCGDGSDECAVDFEGEDVFTAGGLCINSLGFGLLEPSSDVDGECDCVSKTCAYEYSEPFNDFSSTSLGSAGSPGDACTTSGTPGVVTGPGENGLCTCEPLCNVPCIPVGCFENTGSCMTEISRVYVNALCLTSSDEAGTLKLVPGSDQFCECVASR